MFDACSLRGRRRTLDVLAILKATNVRVPGSQSVPKYTALLLTGAA
jgi:hypothetical protein